MKLLTVLFEDSTVLGFQPLGASVPQFEIRCGMFSLRERVELLGTTAGALRLRRHLHGLAADPAWSPATSTSGRCLWLGGRLAPSCDLLAALAAAAAAGPYVLRDERGVLAACVEGDMAADWEASWQELTTRPWTLAAGGWGPPVPASWGVLARKDGAEVRGPARSDDLNRLVEESPLDWIWDVVPRTAAALAADLVRARAAAMCRRPWGVVPAAADPSWAEATRLTPLSGIPAGVFVDDPARVWVGPDVAWAPGVVIDTASGPVVLDRGVGVGAHTFLEGPLYLGPETRVKAGARLYGESSFGVGNRLAGEIGESTFGDFANKQHDGFVGHAVLGSWTNLGAMTTNSDLKNNYGPVRVDLGDTTRDTGLRFVGLLAGDHVKTAIGTLFNTGTVVGFGSNVFGGGMPPKHIPAFSWGGAAEAPTYDVERAMATAQVVMSRRACAFTAAHEALFRHLAGG